MYSLVVLFQVNHCRLTIGSVRCHPRGLGVNFRYIISAAENFLQAETFFSCPEAPTHVILCLGVQGNVRNIGRWGNHMHVVCSIAVDMNETDFPPADATGDSPSRPIWVHLSVPQMS